MRNYLIFLLLNIFSTGNFAQHDDFLQAKTDLMDAAMRSDSLDLISVRAQFEPFTQNKKFAAQAHYYIAFANWQLSYLTIDREMLIELA